jgi:hypothetical protein
MLVTDRSVELPKFSGKRQEFPLWRVKFQALAVVKGLSAATKESSAKLPLSQKEAMHVSDEKKGRRISLGL